MRRLLAALALVAVLSGLGWVGPKWLTFLVTMAAANGLVSLGIQALTLRRHAGR